MKRDKHAPGPCSPGAFFLTLLLALAFGGCFLADPRPSPGTDSGFGTGTDAGVLAADSAPPPATDSALPSWSDGGDWDCPSDSGRDAGDGGCAPPVDGGTDSGSGSTTDAGTDSGGI